MALYATPPHLSYCTCLTRVEHCWLKTYNKQKFLDQLKSALIILRLPHLSLILKFQKYFLSYYQVHHYVHVFLFMPGGKMYKNLLSTNTYTKRRWFKMYIGKCKEKFSKSQK